MFAANVRGKQACSHRKPTHISARQEEVCADVLLALRGPPGDCRQQQEVQADDNDVDETEVAHGVRSVSERVDVRPLSRLPLVLLCRGRAKSEAFRLRALRHLQKKQLTTTGRERWAERLAAPSQP